MDAARNQRTCPSLLPLLPWRRGPGWRTSSWVLPDFWRESDTLPPGNERSHASGRPASIAPLTPALSPPAWPEPVSIRRACYALRRGEGPLRGEGEDSATFIVLVATYLGLLFSSRRGYDFK